MSAFGGVMLTNKGMILQSKAQTGVQLKFTRIAIGDGSLGTNSISALNALINEVKTLPLTKLKVLGAGKAVVGCTLTNQNISTGFFWREVGVFAQDPDVGEILYCYGNAGTNAEYIPASNGADVIEKIIDIITLVGNATNLTATLNSAIQVTSVNGLTGDVVLTPGDIGAAAIDHTHDAASTTVKGLVELATNEETTAGTDTVRAVTPAGLKAVADKKVNTDDVSTTATSNKILKLNSSGKLPADTTGNAATASKLATARTITIAGDASGSGSFDGSTNVSITVEVADDSHNHVIENVDGLPEALNGKASKVTVDELIAKYSIYKSNKDVEGIFTVIEWKRTDGTLYKKSVLSGGTSPQYATQTVTYYNTSGTTVTKTETYALSYDADGDVVSEV